jgi:hypothetical protein
MATRFLGQLQRNPSFSERLNAGIGRGLEQGQQIMQQYQQLKAAKEMGLNPEHLRGLSPENRENFLVDQLKFERQKQLAQAAQKVNYDVGGKEQQGQPSQEQRARERQEFAQELNDAQAVRARSRSQGNQILDAQNSKFFPNNIGPKEPPGNAYQEDTAGKKRPIYTPSQLLQEGARIAAESPFPMTPLEGYAIAKQTQKDNEHYNNQVDKDTANRVNTQREYGNVAEEKLLKVLPNATDEQRALFKRKGEEIAKESKSEADTERFLAKEAAKFKNQMANIKESIEPRRLLSGWKQDLLGTDRKAERAREDIRIKLKPLLDQGLYDTSRNLLSELGYYPEEREEIITSLGESTKRELAAFPKFSKEYKYKHGPHPHQELQPLSEDQQAKVTDSMRNIFKNDPKTNLLLLRRSFEEKGVDWKAFKDAFNDLLLNDEISLDDDQSNLEPLLDNPPLNNLEKILHGLKLIGR